MAKKRKRPRGWLTSPKQVDDWLDIATTQIMEKNYKGVLRTCKRILRYVPPKAKQRAEALGQMGTAYGMLGQFYDAYQAYTKALEINPEDAYGWYNRGMTCRYAARLGQSVRDLERAVELEGQGKMADKFTKELAFSRKMAESEMALRGPDFTLDQLIEQQELFQRGIQLSNEQEWEQAEECFRKSIAMGDCLPQPWGNLGLCLIMQMRLEEAEEAFQRALEIDPDYQRANEHLNALENVRKTGNIPAYGGYSTPFDGKQLNQDILFVEDD